jgi:hypothetical protein
VAKRAKLKQQKLEEIEIEFKSLLLECLRECAQGHWGLFGQNDHVDPPVYKWPEAKRLKELAHEIESLRLAFGQPNPLCERFLQLCSLRGSNAPGEPKLAAIFLDEINQS